LGIAYEKKGDLAAADQSLTNAVTVDAPACKNLQDAWRERADVRMKQARTADAKADYERCRDISAETFAGKACVEALARLP
jgi:Tfp pilus assembly protein PilF